MKIRSMTGYAQVKTHVSDQLTLTVSLKSVNHRFLDLHLRIPSELDQVEMKVRRVLKDRLHRGHIEVTFSVERAGGVEFAVNRELVGGYLSAFRQAAEEFGVSAEPDLNAVLKIAGSAERRWAGRRRGRIGATSDRRAGAGHRAAEPHARGRGPRRGRGVARTHAAPVEGDPRSRRVARRGDQGLSREGAWPHAGANRSARRCRSYSAGGGDAGRAQRHPGRAGAHEEPHPAFPVGTSTAAAKWARSSTSCCRK